MQNRPILMLSETLAFGSIIELLCISGASSINGFGNPGHSRCRRPGLCRHARKDHTGLFLIPHNHNPRRNDSLLSQSDLRLKHASRSEKTPVTDIHIVRHRHIVGEVGLGTNPSPMPDLAVMGNNTIGAKFCNLVHRSPTTVIAVPRTKPSPILTPPICG